MIRNRLGRKSRPPVLRATLATTAALHRQIVSDRLAYPTTAVTIDTYSHVTPSMDADAADLVAASIFGGGKVAKT